MPVECNLVERVSKDNQKYVCLEIKLTNTYKKLVFLTQAEKELLVLTKKN